MTRRRGVGSKETSSRLALFLSIFVGLTIGTGCSLIKIETPNEPIPTNEINVRLSTNAFAVRFAETVEFAADTILAQTTDLEIQLNALRWKINAFRAVRQASFHQAPVEALVDTWVLTTQMANFFQSGLGHDMFGTWQGLVVAQCDELQSDITRLAMESRSTEEFAGLREYVAQEAQRYPLADVSMARRSAVPNWRAFMGIPDSAAVSTLGTLPQALTQVGARLVTASEHRPKEARWNVELFRKRSRVDSLHLHARLDSISSLINRISAVAENSPEILARTVDQLGLELEAALSEVDRQRGATLVALAEERAAIITAFERERAAVLEEVDKTVSHVTDNAMRQVRGLIVEALLIIVVLLVILLVAPFVMGYMLGKARAKGPKTSS